MRIGIIAPPFIPVPPQEYGGTELFIADLANAPAGQRPTYLAADLTGLFANPDDVRFRG